MRSNCGFKSAIAKAQASDGGLNEGCHGRNGPTHVDTVKGKQSVKEGKTKVQR